MNDHQLNKLPKQNTNFKEHKTSATKTCNISFCDSFHSCNIDNAPSEFY